MIQTRGREGRHRWERHDEGWEAHLWPPTKSLFVKKKPALSRLGHTYDTHPQVSPANFGPSVAIRSCLLNTGTASF